MATAISERLKNQASETAGMSRVYNRRGRVLSGYGGTLGGYTMSLQKNNADKEDQIMQNKYENGEIGIDEMIAYLTKTSNRAWLSTEDKKLLTQTIGQMQDKKADADYLDKYNSGTITAKQYLAYKQQRLAKLNTGSALYDSISTDVEQLKKASGKEDLNDYYKREAARISNLDDATSQYAGYENLYRELSTKANSYGLANEANDYLTKAGEYKIEANKASETLKTANIKQEKASLIDGINLAINSYVNNEMSPQEFSGVLDQFQSKAITGGHTDLLKDLNTWSNNAREDVQYGKSFDRGGTRIKGPGVGTGGGATYDIYGNVIDAGGGGTSGGTSYTSGGTAPTGGTNNSGVILPDAGGPTNEQETNQTPEQEDAMFKENILTLQNKLSSGEINTDKFFELTSKTLAARKDDLDKRIGILSAMKPNTKISYNNEKTTASEVIKKINKELNDDWSASLGVDAPDYAKAGINDIYNALDKNPGNYQVIMYKALSDGFEKIGTQAVPTIIKKDQSTGEDYVTSENGASYKLNSVKSGEVIDGMTYNSLKPDEQKVYKYNNQNGNYEKVKEKYVDIDDPESGQFLRYWFKDDGSVKGVQLNGNQDIDMNEYKSIGTGNGIYTPSALNKQIENLKTEQANKTAEEQKLAVEAKAAEPRQLNIVGAKPSVNATKLNIPTETITPTNAKTIGGNINLPEGMSLDPNKPITPSVVKPTFANTQTKLNLTPEQNTAAGVAINKAITSMPQIITSTTSPSVIKSQQAAANKTAQTLKLATPTPMVNPSGIKINLDQSYAPPVQKKTSIWDNIKSLFKR